MTTTMNDLFSNIYSVPQVPTVVKDIITQLNDPDLNMADIAKNVEQETSISLKVLRLVNSAHYGLSRKVSTIHEALMFLGMSELKTLVLASGLVSSMPAVEGFDVEAFWEKSFLKCQYAKSLASDLGLDADLAFTAGLISNVGMILIYLGEPQAALEIEQHLKSGTTRRYDYEQRRLGYTSADVSAELSKQWKFPAELIDIIQHSAHPLSTDDDASPLASLLNIADFVSAHAGRVSDEELFEALPFDVAESVGWDEATLKQKAIELLNMESKLSGLAA
jgi:HD-like signal output (HDOD) protein